jgi:peptidoglycan/LPS O-acetylase OafA/YrhL
MSANISEFISPNEDHPCEKKTDELIRFFLDFNWTKPLSPKNLPDYIKFFLFSGSKLNDLGDYQGCVNMTNSRYFLMNYRGHNFGGISLNTGLCYFKECDKNYLEKVRDHIADLLLRYKKIKLNTTNLQFIDAQERNENYRNEMKQGFYIVICVLSLIFVITFVQFVFNYVKKTKNVEISIKEYYIPIVAPDKSPSKQKFTKLENVLNYFDLNKNCKKIFSVNKTHEKMRIFDGIRLLSTCWVVFGHSFAFPPTIGIQGDVIEFLKTFGVSVIISGFYSVDMFFFMSGFLLTYRIQKLDKTKACKIKIFALAILDRFLRLLPLYLFTLFGITYLLPFIGDGPNYFKLQLENNGCNKYFWHYLLYINNFFNYGPDEQCIGLVWYLANDMQFFTISLAIFIFFQNFVFVKKMIFSTLFFSSLGIQFYLYCSNKYTFLDFVHPNANNVNFINDFYVKPWNRITPYIMGIFFCEFFLQTDFYLRENNQMTNYNFFRKINIFLYKSNKASWLVFLVSIILIAYSVFINVLPNNLQLNIFWHAWFFIINRMVFVFGIACLVHLTFLGKFMFINKICSIKIFSILAKLTYGIYLVHKYVIMYLVVSNPTYLYLKMTDFVFLALGYFIFATVISFIMTVLIETPFVNALKAFLI